MQSNIWKSGIFGPWTLFLVRLVAFYSAQHVISINTDYILLFFPDHCIELPVVYFVFFCIYIFQNHSQFGLFGYNFDLKKSFVVDLPFNISYHRQREPINETRGGSRIFVEGGRIFKKISKFLSTFFFQLSQSTVLLLIWPKFGSAGGRIPEERSVTPPPPPPKIRPWMKPKMSLIQNMASLQTSFRSMTPKLFFVPETISLSNPFLN